MGTILTRHELYDLVWSKPLTKLAKEMEVSDVAIGKACWRAGIPRPGPGYWAKKKSGKKTIRVPLSPRFPGASDAVRIGFRHYYSYTTPPVDIDALPTPPVFEEDIHQVETRIEKMIRKVTCRRLSSQTHPIIAKLLQIDAERESKYAKEPYSWNEPKFTSSVEKRRLRILNAIFLSCKSIGCKAEMSTSQYELDNRDASIRVGEEYISFSLNTIENKDKDRKQGRRKDRLCLTINTYKKSTECGYWEDSEASRLESFLTDIVRKVVLCGELLYRASQEQHYEWQIERRERLIEEERQKQLELARKEEEMRRQKEQERVEKLLNEATALQQAKTIREYVEQVRGNSELIQASKEELDKWVSWALEQADRIDPIKSQAFLSYD